VIVHRVPGRAIREDDGKSLRRLDRDAIGVEGTSIAVNDGIRERRAA